MPRRPRLHVPGGLYHVILRGNGRQPIFFDFDDRLGWEALVAEGLVRYGLRLHAYCWMGNHVHMALQPFAHPLPDFMRCIASRYARSTNSKLKRSGHLFERRHRAILVDAEAYLLELVRYIHRNPLRAGLVANLADYSWSSHLAYARGKGPDWLTLSWVLSLFGPTVGRARARYMRFMAADEEPEVAQGFREGEEGDPRVLGMPNVAAKAVRSEPAATLADLAADISARHGVSVADLRSPSRERRFSRIRAEIGAMAVDAGVATNAELARFFNRSQSSVSGAIKQHRARRGN